MASRLGSYIAALAVFSLLVFSAFPGGAAEQNEVSVDISIKETLSTSENLVEAGEHDTTVELGMGVWNSPDQSRRAVRELEATFTPARALKMEEASCDNCEFTSREPYVILARDIKANDGIHANFRTGIKNTTVVPVTAERSADKTYFESTGIQLASLKVVPKGDMKHLYVNFDYGQSWSGGEPEAEVRFVSASREHFRENRDSRVEFDVEGPTEGREYLFAVQLEVTPLHEKVTYLPNVYIEITTRGAEEERVTGRSFEVKRPWGQFRLTSSEELTFVPQVRKGIGIGMGGVSTSAKLLEVAAPTAGPGEALSPEGSKEPSVVLPMGQPLLGISREGGLYGIDWNFVGVILVVVGTAAGTMMTWVKSRRKRGVVSGYIRQIDSAYTAPEAGLAEKREELKKLKRRVSEEFGRGKLDESAYTILDKRIDDYLNELRSGAGKITNVELKAGIDRILEDGVVTKEEYREFTEMLEGNYELKGEEKEELKRKIKRIRDESEKKGV